MYKIYLLAAFLLLFFIVSSGQAQSDKIVILTPSEIGEFATPITYEKLGDEDDGTYLFKADSNGKYYHFESFVSDGDSQWDALWMYEEKFTASSTLAPSGNIRYDAENLRNDKSRSKGGGIRDVTWCEGAKGYGIGEHINMRVRTKAYIEGKDDEISIWSIMIVNGYARNSTTWKNNSRVKILRLKVGDKHWCDLLLSDIIKPQIFNFTEDMEIYPAISGKKIPEKGAFEKPLNYSDYYEGSPYYSPKTPVYQTDLNFEIIEVYPGDRFDDTCITGIALNFHGGVY